MHTPLIETERLRLRRFTTDDIEMLYLLLKDEEVNTFLPWFPVKTLDEAGMFFEKHFASNYTKAQGYNYGICQKGDNVPIGYINVSMDSSYDFGYALRREFWGKGIMTEAGKAVINQIKQDGLPYITATHDVRNLQSGNVMKRLGMRYCYSYMEQWLPKDIPVIFRMYQLNLNGNSDYVYQRYWDMSEKHFVELL